MTGPERVPSESHPSPAHTTQQVAHLVYLHRRGAGICGQVRPLQVKRPEREDMGLWGVAMPPSRQPPPTAAAAHLPAHNTQKEMTEGTLHSSPHSQSPVPDTARGGEQKGPARHPSNATSP